MIYILIVLIAVLAIIVSHVRFSSKKKVTVLIIDAQVDFHPGGSLAVPGADKDSQGIADLFWTCPKEITDVFVTLDTHHPAHIGHARYWVDKAGKHPDQFTVISNADIKAGKWKPVDRSQQEWVEFYSKRLEENGRFKITIWPDHCLIGTEGHKLVPNIKQALHFWEQTTGKRAIIVEKGMNNNTEMYSIIAAEVPDPNDPTTHRNQALINQLLRGDILVICGEALSHCVNFSLRDIVKYLTPEQIARIYLVRDGSSPVAGFEADAEKFYTDMAALGVNVGTFAELKKRLA